MNCKNKSLGPVFSLVLLVLGGCGAKQDQATMPEMPPPEVDVAEVIQESVTVAQSFTGRVAAPETVELRPRVSGYIDKVAFTEGELVEAGDLLFQIDPRPYQALLEASSAQIAQAQSQLVLAQSEAGRAKSLLDSRAISREEYDQRRSALLGAQATLKAAEAAHRTAQLNVEYTQVTAPVSGRVGRALVTKGNLANADQTLLTSLVSVDPMYVYFDVDEESTLNAQALAELGKSMVVNIGLAGETGFPHQGKLDFIDNQLNSQTGTLKYRAKVNNPDSIFKPGQFARVEMPVAQLERALLVDRKAILTDQDRRFVYVVNQDNTVARRPVVPGRAVDNRVVIQQGLENGDRVVVNGVQKIFGDGMPVAPQEVAMGQADHKHAVAVTEKP